MSSSRNDDIAVEVEVICGVSSLQNESYSNESTGQVNGIHPSDTSILPPLYCDIPGINPLGFSSEYPPTCDEITDPNVPPPTYDSLFGRVRQARIESNGILQFLSKILDLIFGANFRIILVLSMALPIAGIVIGAMNLYDCRADKYIPVFVLVAGSVGVFIQLLNLYSLCKSKENEERVRVCLRGFKSIVTGLVLKCFYPAWFALGCVWVYRAYEPDYENIDSDYYCDKTLYLFSFWLINSIFILFAVLYFVVLCCYGPKNCFKSLFGK